MIAKGENKQMAKEQSDGKVSVLTPEKVHCGIVMPISTIDGCSEQHWSEVKAILIDAIESAGFSTSLVSDADDVGIIQKRIIQNLFENPIVVVDVSGKNPNVMFELGMRLAFDKPTIIVKDDKTSYSFDTSPIEHLEYPRDLRFARILDFKASLAEKIIGTFSKATKDPQYTTFLKHFGKFTVAKLETTEVSKEDYIIKQLQELRQIVMHREAVANDTMLLRSVGADDRRQRGREILKQEIAKIVEAIKGNGDSISLEMIPTITNEVTKRFNIQHLCDSPDEFRDLVRSVILALA